MPPLFSSVTTPSTTILVLSRSFDLFPCLACFQTLLGQTDDAFAVVDMDNDCFNLIADLDSRLRA